MIEPANTPPARLLGASESGRPSGSSTDSTPMLAAPDSGAFANQGRPKALLSEMPSGFETPGMSAVSAAEFGSRFRNSGDCAV